MSEAFLQILNTLRNGKGPEFAFRPYLLATLRNIAIRAKSPVEAEGVDFEELIDPATEGDPAVRRFDDIAVQKAFAALPERWQTVLWLSDVERLSGKEVGELFGIQPNAVAQLHFRAREGLREAWLQAHLNDEAFREDDCRWAIEQMGAFARGKLSPRNLAKMEAHLAVCASCTEVGAEVGSVAEQLRAVLVPVVATGGGAGVIWQAMSSASPAKAAGISAFLQATGKARLLTGALVLLLAGGGTLLVLAPWNQAGKPRTEASVQANEKITRVKITSLSDGAVLHAPPTEISGAGQTGAEILVTVNGGKAVTVVVDKSGTWRANVTLPSGEHTITARQTIGDETSESTIRVRVTSNDQRPPRTTPPPKPGGVISLTHASLEAPSSGALIDPTTLLTVSWTLNVPARSAKPGMQLNFTLPEYLAGQVTGLDASAPDGTSWGNVSGSGNTFTLTFTDDAPFDRATTLTVRVRLAPVVVVWPNDTAQPVTVTMGEQSVPAGSLTLRYAPELVFTEATTLFQQYSSSANDIGYWYSSGVFRAADVGIQQTQTITLDQSARPYAAFDCAAIRGTGSGTGAVYHYGPDTSATSTEFVNNPSNPLGMSIASCSPAAVVLTYTPPQANRGFALSLVAPTVAQSAGDAIVLTGQGGAQQSSVRIGVRTERVNTTFGGRTTIGVLDIN